MTPALQRAHDHLLDESRALRAEEQRLLEQGAKKEARAMDAAALAIEDARRTVRGVLANYR